MGVPRVSNCGSRGPALALGSTVALALLVSAGTVLGASAGPSAPLAELPFEVRPPGIHRPDLSRREVQKQFTSRHPGYLRFLAEHPGRWRAVWNEAAGTPHRIYGDALPLEFPPGAPVDLDMRLEAAARRFLARCPELFPVPGDSLEIEVVKDLERFRLLRFRQLHAGIPVLGSRVEVWIAPGGRVILLGSDVVPEARFRAVAPAPVITAKEAVDLSRAHAGPAGLGPAAPSTRLLYVPLYQGRRLQPRLAWEVRGGTGGGGNSWVYLIAADEAAGPGGGESAGGVLGRWDQVSFGSISGTVEGQASPGLFPDVPWNPPEFAPLSGLKVSAGGSSAITGSDGNFTLSYPGSAAVTVTARLEGPFCKIRNDFTDDLRFSISASSGAQVPIDFNPSPTEFSTSQVNAFLAVNRAHDLIKELDPTFTAVDRPIETHVNINDTCNAFFTPEAPDGRLSFFRKGSCVNTAYSTVIYHEYAHSVVWRAFGDRQPMPAYNEGVADTYAALLSDQPVVGAGFNGVEGAGGIRIRDLSSPPMVYPTDVLLDPHPAGLIVGGSLWEIRQRLGASLGSAAGLDLIRHYWLRSLFLAPPMISPDLTVDFLSLDDDDGKLANGTPHFEEIAGAFARRGLPPPGELVIVHAPLGDTTSLGPFPVEATVRSDFDFITPDSVTFHYSVDGGFFYHSLPMSPAGGDLYRAEIPAQVPGTTVRYFLEAAGNFGAGARFPDRAPGEETVVFEVGGLEQVFADNFDGPEKGWTHALIPNGSPNNKDDWQVGAPEKGIPDPFEDPDGSLLDPASAFSAPNCWGNDIGKDGLTDHNLAPSSQNYLESPAISCAGKHGIHLRFRRWLTVERFDQARVLINGIPVYISPVDQDTLDASWRLLDYDVSTLADDRAEVRIRFDLNSSLRNNAGGWNIDDVSLVATGQAGTIRPTLASVQPDSDFKSGGGHFMLRGSRFTTVSDTRLYFGQASVIDFEVVDAATITGTVPPASPGLQTISLENASGAASLPDAFTYFDLPVLDEVIPARGGTAGGTPVSFLGDYFPPDCEVLVGGNAVESLLRIDQKTVLGQLPPAEDVGAVEVVIRGRFGESRFPGAFTYAEPPVLDSVEPPFGLLAGGAPFTLRGDWFPVQGQGVTLDFGARRITDFTVRSRTEISGVVPPGGAPGPVDIRIETPGGSAVIQAGFTYFAVPPAIFLRGDVNLDRKFEITDAILILAFLFQGGSPLPCLDAADVTDDGALDISDPVRLLSFLFSGGENPPRPYPDPGPDPSGDPSGCQTGL